MDTGNKQYSEEEEEDEENWKHDMSANKQGHHDRCIVHIDIDCFYAQVEMLLNPSLKDKPLGIQQKNIIVTCNYKARERGLTKLMYLKDAKEKCKDLIIVNGEDLTKYRAMSEKIASVVKKFSPTVEKLGMDENFVDVTSMCSVIPWKHMGGMEPAGFIYGSANLDCQCGCIKRLTIGSHIVQEIRQTLQEELGITSCGGTSYNKLLAKLVGSIHKPNKQTVLYPGSEHELMNELGRVRKIPGIGSSTSKRLANMGIVSVSHLNEYPIKDLEKEFGDSSAKLMKQLAVGTDYSAVVPSGKLQSMSDEDSFKRCDSLVDAKNRINSLITSLLRRVLDDGRIPQTLRLSIRKFDPKRKYFGRESRQCPLPPAAFHNANLDNMEKISHRLGDLTMDLFKKMVNERNPFHLTLINVCLTRFSDKSAKSGGIKAFFKSKEDSEGEQEDIMDFSDSESLSSNQVHPASSKKPQQVIDRFSNNRKDAIETEISKEMSDSLSGNNSINYSIRDNYDTEMEGVSMTIDPVDKEKYDNLCKSNQRTFCSTKSGENCERLSFFKRKNETIQGSPLTKNMQNSVSSSTESSSFCVKRSRRHGDDKNMDVERKNTNSSYDVGSLLPAGIDIDTLKELPSGIQKEKIITDQISRKTDFSQKLIFTSESLSLDKNSTRAHSSQSSFLSSTPLSPSKQVLPSSSQPVQSQQTKSSIPCDIPPGIDQEVFIQLPAYVQRAVIADYNAQQVGKEFKEMKASKSPFNKSKPCHKGKQSLGNKKSAQKNISSFFKNKS